MALPIGSAALRSPRPAGPRRWVPLTLLLVSVGTSGLAAYRGQAAVRSQRATGEALLRDYATFAAWSFGNHVGASLESAIRSVLSPPRTQFLFAQTPAPCLEELHHIATTRDGCLCDVPLGGRFTFLLRPTPDSVVRYVVGHPPAVEELESVASAVVRHARAEYGSTWAFAVLEVAESPPRPPRNHRLDHSVLVAYTRLASTQGDTVLYGFELDRSRLVALLEATFGSADLLPPTLARHRSNDVLLAVAVNSPAGARLYASPTGALGMLGGLAAFTGEAVTRDLSAAHRLPESLGGGAVAASVLPAAAELLVAGGMPRSQVPWLFLIFALSGGLGLIALSQLRREGQLAALRSDFVASVSHELRTPLAQVRLYLETLRLERYDTREEKAWILASADREAIRLTHLVDNVLTFSRAERGLSPGNLQVVDIGSDVRSIVAEFRPLAATRRVTIGLNIESACYSEIERDGLRQTLVNLLDNAVKYGPVGQTVMIRCRTVDGRVLIEVEDCGPGVPADERQVIWQPFYRGKRALGSVAAGSGIGLAVVSAFAAAHGGKAYVGDAGSGGARFVVELPRAREPKSQATLAIGPVAGHRIGHEVA